MKSGISNTMGKGCYSTLWVLVPVQFIDMEKNLGPSVSYIGWSRLSAGTILGQKLLGAGLNIGSGAS